MGKQMYVDGASVVPDMSRPVTTLAYTTRQGFRRRAGLANGRTSVAPTDNDLPNWAGERPDLPMQDRTTRGKELSDRTTRSFVGGPEFIDLLSDGLVGQGGKSIADSWDDMFNDMDKVAWYELAIFCLLKAAYISVRWPTMRKVPH